ncbi:universal stress protein [Bradyrhizobium sp. B024]|uniref:Universal stress protein UspA n=1 Tax=Bradyrhizobium diazoefficiens TaxID=1355477 RepID=A0A810BNT2_9BRAD|nr:nucleotide-binding universal stress UspA family protein [Bradyrhizobium japonicum]BCE33577.1 universal stress protein UspA [Bradyrhizobium diazoefficiens]BCE77193.1 universal stress protein UspA [Bradyrhizobium diazoefficiens]BCF20653.1 universal stress protein UspA [Bradyrhizobium diazoefficiens]
MIKDILVNLEHNVSRDRAREFAITVAEAFDAHVAGVAFAYAPAFPGYVMLEIPPNIVAGMVEESKKAAEAAIRRFDEAAKRSLLSAEHRLTKTIGLEAPTLFAALARRFDLSIFLQSNPDGVTNDDMIESSLFESGRPVIVVPYIHNDRLKLDRVVCCWDGGRAAARAINDAMPLLVKADKIDLLIIENDKTKNETTEIRGVEMASHLARHDVNVEVKIIPAPDIAVADAILSHVADESGTLIVMGGYGHSKLREVILGGVTRAMLKSMTAPVFMSH